VAGDRRHLLAGRTSDDERSRLIERPRQSSNDHEPDTGVRNALDYRADGFVTEG
jgi:hypothetical protein